MPRTNEPLPGDLPHTPALRTFYLERWDKDGRHLGVCTMNDESLEAAEKIISATFGIPLPFSEDQFAAYGRFAIFDISQNRLFPPADACPVLALDMKSIKPAPP